MLDRKRPGGAVMDANQQNLSTLGVRKQLLKISGISNSNLILKVHILICKQDLGSLVDLVFLIWRYLKMYQ